MMAMKESMATMEMRTAAVRMREKITRKMIGTRRARTGMASTKTQGEDDGEDIEMGDEWLLGNSHGASSRNLSRIGTSFTLALSPLTRLHVLPHPTSLYVFERPY